MKSLYKADETAEPILELAAIAQKLEKEGKKVFYLNIGDPTKFDFHTPRHLVNAMRTNCGKSSFYADPMGLLDARVAVAKEATRLGIQDINEDKVLITAGGSEGITFSIEALLNHGGNILVPNPCYTLYKGLISFFKAEKNEYLLNEGEEWQPNLENMRKKINNKTKAIVLINPNNPTGTVYPKKTVKEVIALAGEFGIPILADETYDKLLLDNDKHFSCAALSKDVPVITFNSLSKSYLCPGWRVGWVIFHDPTEKLAEIRECINKLARLRLSSNHPVQFAIKPALEGNQSHIEKTKKKLRRRRDIAFKRLNENEGLSCVKPKAAFYAFPKIEFPMDDKKFVTDMLNEEGVLLVFGSGFGCPSHFRLVFLPQEEILEEAFDRLDRFVKKKIM